MRPKPIYTNVTRLKDIIRQYYPEFKSTAKNTLYCNVCMKSVSYEKLQMVTKHRDTKMHLDRLCSFSIQGMIKFTPVDFREQVVDTWISGNMPLNTLGNHKSKSLFKSLNAPLPSETSCRETSTSLAKKRLLEIKNKLQYSNIFLVIDEAIVQKKKFVNILLGDVISPAITYLVDTKCISTSPNNEQMVIHIDEKIKESSISRNNFLPLLSDADHTWLKLVRKLKNHTPQLFHVTCMLHLIHNCCLNIKSYYEDVNKVISAVKISIVKNADRQSKFLDIGMPPTPILTRWGSWLKASQSYFNNIIEVRRIYNEINDSEILITKTREALNQDSLTGSLVEINQCYSSLIELLPIFENSKFTIKEAYETIKILNLGTDPVGIKGYIESRLNTNDTRKINEMQDSNTSPAIYSFLQKCQPTSASVERSFSKLNKLLSDDRNFKTENIKDYMILYSNNFM